MSNHGGDIKGVVDKYGLDEKKIIDFSANINFLGPPAEVIEAIEDNLLGIINYPEPDSRELKRVLAEELQLKDENLILGNGAVELIYILARVLNPKKTMVLAPTFSEYMRAVESVGSEVVQFQLRREEGFKINVDRLISSLFEIDILFLCNPNNPTGQYISRNEIIKILDYARDKGVFLVVDEAFVDFLDEEVTVIDLVNKYDNIFVLRSLTKFFAIPGLRVGYGAGNSNLIEKLAKSKDPWNLNYFAQLATKVALEQKDYIEETKLRVKEEREFLHQNLSKLPDLKVYPPSANYIFIDISKLSITATELVNDLAKEAILVRNCNNYFGLGEDFVRVAVKSREDNLKLLEKFRGK